MENLQGAAENAIWLLLLPLLASIATAFVTRPLPLLSATVSWGSTLSCLFISGQIFWERLHGKNIPSYEAVAWVSAGPGSTGLMTLPVGIFIDNLTAAMLVMVCFIGLLIQIYSYSYMSTEVHHFPTQGPDTVSRFFACLNLFLFSMLGLLISASTLQIYIFWELVGLCSYLLIGFWYFKTSAAVASRKAFVVTKFADLGFLLGVLCLGAATQTFLFPTMLSTDLSQVSPWLLNIGLVLLFCGAIGKSAQFPLNIWLPDAMEGPTPVSALIHAATMVAAGVYLVARCAPLYEVAPYAAATVAWIGAITALLAATIALVQNDIKKILAYSTVSQLGFMLTALGAGATVAGVFHLITHAFFKALLFLGSGAIILACHSNDIWRMGGVRQGMRYTHFAFLTGCLALAGIPPFAGFFSKDEILGGLTHHPGLLAVLTLTAFLTAFYVGRLYWVVFPGRFRGNEEAPHFAGPVPSANLPAPIDPAKEIFQMQPFWNEERAAEHLHQLPAECLGALSEGLHPHHGEEAEHESEEEAEAEPHQPQEVSPMMFLPLLILSFFAIFLGWVGLPGEYNQFGHVVFPQAKHHPANFAIMALSVVIAFSGLALAYWLYSKDPLEGEERFHRRLGRFKTVLQQKWYLDHFWARALARLVYFDAKMVSRFDEQIVDGAVYASGRATYRSGQLLRAEQSGQLQRYALMLAAGFLVIVFAVGAIEPQFLWSFWQLTAAIPGGQPLP